MARPQLYRKRQRQGVYICGALPEEALSGKLVFSARICLLLQVNVSSVQSIFVRHILLLESQSVSAQLLRGLKAESGTSVNV